MRKIEFVDYDYSPYCLCAGVLHLLIEGKEITFGYKDDCDFDRFWASGGSVTFDEDWNENVEEGDWQLSLWNSKIKQEFSIEELEYMIDLMNKNVEKGCCGGCV